MTKIVTQLDKEAVLAALRELAPAEHNPRLFRSTFEGKIDPQRLVVGYRFGSFILPSGWTIYILVGWLVVVAPVSFYRYAADGNYYSIIWTLFIPIGLFLLGRAFVRSTQEYVVDEIGRAVRKGLPGLITAGC